MFYLNILAEHKIYPYKFIPEEFVATLNVARTQSLKGFKAMVRLVEDIAEFLSEKGDELYQEVKKLLDKLLAWIKKNKKIFRKQLKKIFFYRMTYN